jgi:hypothetical protein
MTRQKTRETKCVHDIPTTITVSNLQVVMSFFLHFRLFTAISTAQSHAAKFVAQSPPLFLSLKQVLSHYYVQRTPNDVGANAATVEAERARATTTFMVNRCLV